jgi:hypothetical protein
VGKINGVALIGLGTGILKNSTVTGQPGIAVASDFPTLNQNTTGTASNVTGVVAVANGGTGASTLTGYVKGSGTSALTASSTIPNTDISGLGTMSTQAASSVAITGGSINNTPIGASTPNTGAFTTLTASTPIGTASGGTGVNTTPSNGQVLIGNGTGYTANTLTAGSGITITNASGSITVAAAGGVTGVSSVTGTANEITATTVSGAVTLSLPSALTFTGKTITGGTLDVGDIYSTTLSSGFTSVASAGTVTTLTASSVRDWTVTGSSGQTYQLPDATTLRNGAMFQFNNNQSSGTIVVRNNSATTVATIQSGGYVEIILLSNATAAGSWDVHNQAPSNVTWSTNTFDYAGSITSATWNGTAVAINRGGTGQATAQLAINALAGATTSGYYLRGNGSNVVMSAIQAADVPTLNQSTTGSAATLTTPRAIYGNNFDGSAALTQVIASTYGGTGNGFTKFSGPTTAERTFTLPDSNATLLYSGGALGTPSSGTVTNLTGTASININGTVGATTASTGAFTTITGSGLTITNNTTNLGRIRVSNTGSTAGNYRGYEIFNGATFKGGFLQDESTDAISVFVTGGVAQVFNADKSITMANGLAVTGALSSTGNYNVSAGFKLTQNTNAYVTPEDNVRGAVLAGTGAAYLMAGGSVIAGATSTGLAVTGALSATSTISTSKNGDSFYSATYQGVQAYSWGVHSSGKFALNENASFTGTDLLQFSPYPNYGLAVTGTLSTTGAVTVDPNSAGRVAPTGSVLINNGAYSSTTTMGKLLLAGGPGNNNTNSAWYLGAQNTGGVGAPAPFLSFGLAALDTGTSFNTFTEKMRIDSSGNVGIGTSSPIAKLDVTGSINFGPSNGSCVAVGTTNTFTPSGGNPTAYYGMTFGGFVTNSISLSGYNGIAMYTGAGVERARIDSSGNLLVGTTSAAGNLKGIQANNTSSTQWPLYTTAVDRGLIVGMSATDGIAAYFMTSTSTPVGSINCTSTATTYVSISDYRRKSNVKDLTGSGTFIDALKPRTFDWDSGDKGVGFIAHEFAEVSPTSVTGVKDAVDADGKPIYQAMQAGTSEVIANLVAEIQELRKRMAAVEGK